MEKETPAQQSPEKTQPTKSKTNYKKLTIILVIVLVLAGLVGWRFLENSQLNPFSGNQQAALQDIDPNEPIARVNGEEVIRAQLDNVQAQMVAQQGIDPSTLDNAARQQIINQALNTIITQTLLRQEVDSANISITEEEIDTQLETIQGQYESEEAFQQALNSQGVTVEQLRTQISSELETQAYLSQELDFESLTASEEEVNNAYSQLQENSEEEVQPLEQIRSQLEQAVIQQKQQQVISQHVQQLQQSADIELLI